MATVLLVPGAMSDGNTASVEGAFGGPQEVANYLGITGPLDLVPISYNDWDTFGGAADGANKIAAELHALPANETKIVVGHSYGAVANCQLIREEATLLAGIDPATVTFVNAANSIRLNTGYSTMMGLYGPGGGPVSNKWRTYDVAREFDKWADQPNVWTSAYYWQAVNNCNTGDNTGTPSVINGVPNNIHNNYTGVRLGAPHAERTIGSVTFMLFETDPLPGSNGATRAQLETAYNRIVAPTW